MTTPLGARPVLGQHRHPQGEAERQRVMEIFQSLISGPLQVAVRGLRTKQRGDVIGMGLSLEPRESWREGGRGRG